MGTLTGSIIGNWVSNAFYGILLTIDYVIYLAINICYQLFEVVSKVEVFSTENVGVISRRIYTIIGIVMLFVFAYNIILAIVDPDSLSKGEKSVKNIVQNTIISIVLVTLFPLICEYMQIFQNHIIENNTIGNLIMGSTASDSGENGQTKGALNVSVTIFTAFYHPIDENKEPVTLTECESSSVKLCSRYKEMADNAKNGIGGLWNFMHDEDLKDGIYDDDMEYLFPLSTIAGVVAAYLFLSFSLDLGVRAAKLGALKLIAPIPIFLRITKPKGGQFDKWFSEFTKTYLQVFERIVIINFAMLLISFVSDINIFASGGGIFINVIATVVVILGILKFAKDAPKLIEDIFSVKIPQMSLKKKLNDNEYAKRAASLGGAAAGVIAKPFWNNGKAIVEGFKKDENGKRHILRGFGRFATGTIRDIPGTIPSALNAGRRGWQNGNVSDWRQVQDAITTARVQNEVDINAVKNHGRNAIDKANKIFGPDQEPVDKLIGDWATKKATQIDGFVNVGGASNEKLTAAKNLQSSFDTLFNAFIDKSIEDAKNSALKDYQNGKKVKFRTAYDFTDANGNERHYDAGTDIPVSDLNPEIIKSKFEELQRESLTKKFNKEIYSDAIKQQGETICKQMEKSMNVLGKDVITGILENNGVDSIEELSKLFDKAGKVGPDGLQPEDIEKLRKISFAVGDQVKANSFANTVEKQKDKK